MAGMSTPKKKAGAKPPRGPAFTIRFGPERDAAIQRYIDLQEVQPDKTAVVLKAVDKFLAEKGLWPPGQKE